MSFQIEEFSRTVQLWLSDTKTLLKVIVAAAAAERFEREHKRRVTEGTLGAVIQILDYEIVAQHHGPKRTKITMLINNFRHIGSDGSPPFGNPSSLECQPPIIELLEKLQKLRAQEQPSSQSLAPFKAATIVSASQANSVSSADDSLDKSQAEFATQIPRLQSKKRLREGSLKSNEYQNNALYESDSVRSLNTVKDNDGSDRALDAKSSFRHEVQALELSPSHDRQASSNAVDIQKNSSDQSDSENRVPEQEEPEKLPRNEIDHALAKRTESLLCFLKRDNAKRDNLGQRVPKPCEQIKQDPQGPVRAASAASKDPSPDRQTKASLPPFQRSRVTKPARKSRKVWTLVSLPAIFANIMQASTRITGRDIRISQNQRDILDRTDCEYQPSPFCSQMI